MSLEGPRNTEEDLPINYENCRRYVLGGFSFENNTNKKDLEIADKLELAYSNDQELLMILKLIEQELIYQLLLRQLNPADKKSFEKQLKIAQKTDEATVADLKEAVRMSDEERRDKLSSIQTMIQYYFEKSL